MVQLFENWLFLGQFVLQEAFYSPAERLKLYLGSDLLMAVASYSIAAWIIYWLWRREDILYSRILLLCSAGLMFASGTSHLIGIGMLWYPSYWLFGGVKVAIALVAVCTVLVLVRANTRLYKEQLNKSKTLISTSQLKDYLDKQTKLCQERQFLHNIYQQVESAIFVVDVLENGTFRFAGMNPAYERLTGLKSDDLSGKSPEQVLPAAIAEKVIGHYQECVCRGTTIYYEQGLPVQGKDTWWLTSLSPLREQNADSNAPDDRIYRLIGTSTEITERKQVEAAVQKLNEQLEVRVQERTNELIQANRQLLTLIIEQHQVEEALRESEEKYRSVVNNLKEVIFQTDASGLWTFLNPAWTKITGFAVEETIGKNLENYIYPDDRQHHLEMFQPLLTGEKDYCSYEIRYLTKSVNSKNREIPAGSASQIADRSQLSYRWIEVYAQLIRADDETLSIYGTLNDITERKRSADSLRDSEERFRQLAENIHEVFWMFTLDAQQMLYVSPAYEKIWGFSCQSLYEQPRSWLNAVFPDDRDRVKIALENLLKSETSRFNEEYRIVRPDGSIRTIWSRCFGVRNQNGEVYRIVGIAEDISDRIEAIEALRQSEERFRRAFEDAAIGIALVAIDGRFLKVNHSLCQMLGYSEEELQATSSDAITHPNDWDINIKYQSRILSGEIRSYQIEKRYIHKSGHAIWTEVTISLVYNIHGQPLYQVSQILDITERKRAETEIINALAKEKQLSELKYRFISMTSHEFRTPLTTILSASELLEYYSYKWTDAEKLRQLHLIQASVKHMTDLLDDILLIGRAEAGKIELKPVPIELIKICSDLITEIKSGIGAHHSINLVCDSHKQNREIIEACMDEKLLRQILCNLLSNAIKYSPQSEPITLAIFAQNEEVIFHIKDRGIGIPAEDQKYLFEFFHRATNVGTIPGTGLGLAIVKKCVELHRGHIILFSKVGVGTTVTVTLPQHQYR